MRLGLFDAAFGEMPFGAFLDLAAEIGCGHVELGAGAYVGAPHLDAPALLADAGACRRALAEVAARGLRISALSCHGNPLHPDEAVRGPHRAAWEDAKRLAAALEVPTLVTFSGLPGGGPGDRVPNWHVASWPADHPASLRWQWEAVALPYWEAEARSLAGLGLRAAIEMHAGFLVHSPATALRLIEAAGPAVAVNLDPSHLFWQRIEPAAAARHLAGHVAHVHAKDTRFAPRNLGRIGVLDTGPHDDEPRRAWVFRTPGEGHGAEVWQALAQALAEGGYDGALSLEHEDPLCDAASGARAGAAFLRSALGDRLGGG